MAQWLYERLKSIMTADWRPDFALQNSVRWPIALMKLAGQGQFDNRQLREFYLATPRRPKNPVGDSLAFESLLMALHNHAALHRISRDPAGYSDLVRAATVAWYYGIYCAASAMVAAADGSRQENHTATAKSWGRQVLLPGYVVPPFSYYTSTLVKKGYEAEIDCMRAGNAFSLNDDPVDIETAYGGVLSYIKGTAKRDRVLLENRIRSHRDFAALGVTDFRKKVAREFRDKQLAGRQTNFLNQAIRFRGKANYRDSVYLSYGQPRPEWISQMVTALYQTLTYFLRMTCRFCERRVEKGVWIAFAGDLAKHCQFDLDDSLLQIE